MINKDKPQPNPLDYTEAPLDIDEYRTTIANTRNISDQGIDQVKSSQF